MHDPPLNPSQQVERIREILVGRQLQHVEDRIRQIEAGLEARGARTADDVAEGIASFEERRPPEWKHR